MACIRRGTFRAASRSRPRSWVGASGVPPSSPAPLPLLRILKAGQSMLDPGSAGGQTGGWYPLRGPREAVLRSGVGRGGLGIQKAAATWNVSGQSRSGNLPGRASSEPVGVADTGYGPANLHAALLAAWASLSALPWGWGWDT